MAAKGRVPRPTKTTEHPIVFATREAHRGWTDLAATQRNALTDAWDFLTTDPLRTTSRNHPLRGSLQLVTRGGETHERWQYELTGGARIWYYVDSGTVYLEQVHTHHPNQTK